MSLLCLEVYVRTRHDLQSEGKTRGEFSKSLNVVYGYSLLRLSITEETDRRRPIQTTFDE